MTLVNTYLQPWLQLHLFDASVSSTLSRLHTYSEGKKEQMFFESRQYEQLKLHEVMNSFSKTNNSVCFAAGSDPKKELVKKRIEFCNS